MSSIEPDDGGGEVDSAEESLGVVIVAGCYPPERLESGEAILDQMSGFVHHRHVALSGCSLAE